MEEVVFFLFHHRVHRVYLPGLNVNIEKAAGENGEDDVFADVADMFGSGHCSLLLLPGKSVKKGVRVTASNKEILCSPR